MKNKNSDIDLSGSPLEFPSTADLQGVGQAAGLDYCGIAIACHACLGALGNAGCVTMQSTP